MHAPVDGRPQSCVSISLACVTNIKHFSFSVTSAILYALGQGPRSPCYTEYYKGHGPAIAGEKMHSTYTRSKRKQYMRVLKEWYTEAIVTTTHTILLPADVKYFTKKTFLRSNVHTKRNYFHSYTAPRAAWLIMCQSVSRGWLISISPRAVTSASPRAVTRVSPRAVTRA